MLSESQRSPADTAETLREGTDTFHHVMKALADLQQALRPVQSDSSFGRFIDKFLALPDPGSQLLKLHKHLQYEQQRALLLCVCVCVNRGVVVQVYGFLGEGGSYAGA